MSAPRVRVYLAMSLDGCIAGPGDDLGWLQTAADPEAPPADPGAVTFEGFLADVGALLMGRRTHDVVAGFGAWPYGDRPVLVATHRALEPAAPGVRAVTGDIGALVDQALDAAGGRDVYLDGGELVRQALDAGLVDQLVLTVVPTVLGGGVRLFDGLAGRHDLRVDATHRFDGGMIQLVLRPRR